MPTKKFSWVLLFICLNFPINAHAGFWSDFQSWTTSVVETVVEVIQEVEDAVTGAIKTVVESVESIYDSVTETVESSLNLFFSAANETASALSNAGLDVDISHWFTSDEINSPDNAQHWSISNYAVESDLSDYREAFRQRQADYITNLNLSAEDSDKNSHRIMRVFLDLPIDEEGLRKKLAEMFNPEKHAYKNPDMVLIGLIRIIADSDLYDELILKEIAKLPFWQDEDTEGRSVYTSENHVLMWMSTAWLLFEMEGWHLAGGPEVLRERLVRYLEVKKAYGIYESLSTVYSRYSLTSLLNLYDYSEDEEIKTLAGEVAILMLNDIAMAVNDLGAGIAVDARAYQGNYMRGDYTNTDFAGYAAMTTGLGSGVPVTGSMDVFAMTSLDVSEVAYNRLNVLNGEVNLSYTFGHSINQIDSIWAGLSQQDKVIFAQSGGAYGHPEVLDDMLDVYLDPLAGLSSYLEDLIHGTELVDDIMDMSDVLLNKTSKPFTTSSVIMEKTMDLYRNGNVQLTSLQNFHPGYAGWQQQPWVATAGSFPVYTRSGAHRGGWKASVQEQMNTHLPYIKQNGHVALVLYKPAMELRFMSGLASNSNFLPVDDFLTPVNLYWPEETFHETARDGNWIFGREDDGYVAVYRHCLDTKIIEEKDEHVEINSCDDNEQVWAAVVGNSETHGSFSDFISTVSQAKIKSKWYWSWTDTRHVWKTMLEVDGVTISYSWKANVDDLMDGDMWGLAHVNDTNKSQMDIMEPTHSMGQPLMEETNYQITDTTDSLEETTISPIANPPLEKIKKRKHKANRHEVSAVSFELPEGDESGMALNVTHVWRTIDLNFSYKNPVVYTSVVGESEFVPAVVQIRNSGSDSFELRVETSKENSSRNPRGVNVQYVIVESDW